MVGTTTGTGANKTTTYNTATIGGTPTGKLTLPAGPGGIANNFNVPTFQQLNPGLQNIVAGSMPSPPPVSAPPGAQPPAPPPPPTAQSLALPTTFNRAAQPG